MSAGNSANWDQFSEHLSGLEEHYGITFPMPDMAQIGGRAFPTTGVRHTVTGPADRDWLGDRRRIDTRIELPDESHGTDPSAFHNIHVATISPYEGGRAQPWQATHVRRQSMENKETGRRVEAVQMNDVFHHKPMHVNDMMLPHDERRVPTAEGMSTRLVQSITSGGIPDDFDIASHMDVLRQKSGSHMAMSMDMSMPHHVVMIDPTNDNYEAWKEHRGGGTGLVDPRSENLSHDVQGVSRSMGMNKFWTPRTDYLSDEPVPRRRQ